MSDILYEYDFSVSAEIQPRSMVSVSGKVYPTSILSSMGWMEGGFMKTEITDSKPIHVKDLVGQIFSVNSDYGSWGLVITEASNYLQWGGSSTSFCVISNDANITPNTELQ